MPSLVATIISISEVLRCSLCVTRVVFFQDYNVLIQRAQEAT